jgi:hypothetical protein
MLEFRMDDLDRGEIQMTLYVLIPSLSNLPSLAISFPFRRLTRLLSSSFSILFRATSSSLKDDDFPSGTPRKSNAASLFGPTLGAGAGGMLGGGAPPPLDTGPSNLGKVGDSGQILLFLV